MNEYIFIFRFAPNKEFNPTVETESSAKQAWGKWIGKIAAQVKFVSTHRIGFEGTIVHSNLELTAGFYQDSATKEIVSGTMIVKSDSLKKATEIAQGCPILTIGGSVEVRDLIPMGN